MKSKERLELFFGVLIIVIILGAYFSFSTESLINNWIIPLGISFILSGIIGDIIEGIRGKFLKKISLPIKIGKFKFSISAFAVLVVVLKIWIFRKVV